MDLSMKWLNEYVKADMSIKDFAADMTMSGSKVEKYTIEGSELKNIVIGKVLSVEKHPNADSLFVCKINTGKDEPVQIVTGADNVVPDSFVPVALDNSVVHGGKAIKKGKLRGELSEGMLCSLEELGLAHGDFPYAIEDGIFLVEEECHAGQPIQEAIGLDDTVVEFEITPNRPDCLSVLGLARETAATYNIPLDIKIPAVKGGAGDINELVSVKVENNTLCTRYAAAAAKNIKIQPSPRWMRERLRASGVRPINNIVDITNYVMLEYGQPMHAFDLKHVKGAKIIVRNAHEGETIVTLDGTTRTLSPDMLVIADESSPSGVAGVMGGEFSGIYDDTTTIIFESACFNGPSIRTTAKKLGLRTESSSRFEKGLDPENCMPALKRACELLELLGAGEVCDNFIDISGTSAPAREIPFVPDWINTFLGIDISENEMLDIMRRVDFKIENGKITPPSYRGDVETKADIAEEIARIHGYNNIPTRPLQGVAEGHFTPSQKFERSISSTLLAQGCTEIITYSFISPKYYTKIALPENSPLRNSVLIQNPLGEDTSVMRTTAIPSILEVLARNYSNRAKDVALFEIATIYIPVAGEKLPIEKKKIMIGCYGSGQDFFSLKGIVSAVLTKAGISADFEAESTLPTFHPGRCANIVIDGNIIGTMGELHPVVCGNYEIDERVYVAELDLNTLLENANTEKTYSQLPRFPASTRDLALVCDEDVPVGSIEKIISDSAKSLLEKLELFDVYRGLQVGVNKKSVAYSLTLRAVDHTLTDDECDKTVQRILKRLDSIGVSLRG